MPSSLSDQLTQMEGKHSPLETALRKQSLAICTSFLSNDHTSYRVPSFAASRHKLTSSSPDVLSKSLPHLAQLPPYVLEATSPDVTVSGKHIAVLFSGGPASGGHNVLWGIQKALGSTNTLVGIRSGPKGLLAGDLFDIHPDMLRNIYHLGGFDFLGSDRTKIKTPAQFDTVREVVIQHRLDGLIVVGGDDSNTNAAFLAEALWDLRCAVVGVPKTIDGDLQVGAYLPISFGFDTATKIYAELVGNILQDTPSSQKYWHFIKLMGRSASHVALEVALQTKATITLLSEDIRAQNKTLDEIVSDITDIIVTRAKTGRHYGVVLIPEGLIECLPATALGSSLGQLDSHGNLSVSQIPTEQLLIDQVTSRLATHHPLIPFSTVSHFFGYEGRCGAPTRFDASYTANLGLIAGSLALGGHTGYMAALSELDRGGKAFAIPIASLLGSESRNGKETLVIQKSLVDLESPAFKYFESRKHIWATEDVFCNSGPVQYFGPTSLQLPFSVALNQGYLSPTCSLGQEILPNLSK